MVVVGRLLTVPAATRCGRQMVVASKKKARAIIAFLFPFPFFSQKFDGVRSFLSENGRTTGAAWANARQQHLF